MTTTTNAQSQRGGFVMGLVAGLLLGLSLALGVALYITKAPIPFVNKVPQRTAEQDQAEAERNRSWNPNAPLAAKPVIRGAASAVEGADAAAPVSPPPPGIHPAPPSARDPAAILSGAATPPPARAPADAELFTYFVQAGAFTRSDDADQQRARLAMAGHSARITEREQAGRVVYRVRMGPFATRDEADGMQARLRDQAIESQIVRVEKR